MNRPITILAVFGIAAAFFAAVQWRKHRALAFLAQYGEIGDWYFFRYPLATETSIPPWLPGIWPRSLAINEIPPDTTRYAASLRKLPRLDTIMVFVYEPMSLDIFTALGAIPGAKILDLTSTSVDDSAFQKFTQIATVEELLLDHSAITDASLPHILRFRHVRTLSLYLNSLSDSGVLQLSQLPELSQLSVDERLTAQTIAALRAKRPDIELDQ